MKKTFDFIRQVMQKKTIYRLIFNWRVDEFCHDLAGKKVLDLAGGGEASYYDYLPKDINVTRTNRIDGCKIDLIADLNKKLPFDNGAYDAVLLFNALYIVEDPIATLIEVRRVLKPGGTLYLASPFTANEMPEPHDYGRFTYEGLEKMFRASGFRNVKIIRFGERFTSAAYILHLFFVFSVIRLFVYSLAMLCDKLIPRKLKTNYPLPLGYFCVVTA
jgi:SAM-dependent methyltransferase